MVEEYNERYLEEKFTHINELFDEKLKGVFSGLGRIEKILNEQVKLMTVSQKDVASLREKHDKDVKDLVSMTNTMAHTWNDKLDKEVKNLNDKFDDKIKEVEEKLGDLKVEREAKTNEVMLKIKYTQIGGAVALILIIFIVVEESRDYILHLIEGLFT